MKSAFLLVFVSLLVGAFSYLIAIDQQFSNFESAVLAILAFLITSIIENKFYLIKVLESADRFKKLVDIAKTDEHLSLLMLRLTENYEQAKVNVNFPFNEFVSDKIVDFTKDIENASAGRIRVKPRGRHSFGHIGMEKTNVSILAATNASHKNYWESDWGVNYIQIQKSLIKKGVKIQRVFILNGNRKPGKRLLELMQIQKDIGITVYYVNSDVLINGNVKVKDFLVQDNSMVVEVTLDSLGVEVEEFIDLNPAEVNSFVNLHRIYVHNAIQL